MANERLRTDLGLLILRIGVGGTMLFYGSQKMLGLFGGAGYAATVDRFTQNMGIPPVFAHLAIVAEFFGGLGILLGGLTPIAAFGVMVTMFVATQKSGIESGAFSAMLSSGSPQDANRFFYPLTLGISSLALLLMGAGQYSLDASMFGKRRGTKGK